MPGFAIVGCGMIASFHLMALAEIEGARVVAVIDEVPAALERFKDKHQLNCQSYSQLAPALENPAVDIVIVSTPSGAHMAPAMAAAAAGKHVVVEKPLEVTLERCDCIIEACDRNRVKLCTILPSRFADANRTLKAAVDDGCFGRLTLGETTCKWWRTQDYYDQSCWRGTMALDGGGALMNQAIHSVDLLLWIMGPVTHVMGYTARLAHRRIEVEDTAVGCLRFKSGALGVVLAATSAYPGFPKTIAIHGDRGSAIIEQEDVREWIANNNRGRKRFAREVGVSGGSSDPSAISHVGHAHQLRDFVEAIQTGRSPLVDGREGRRAVEAVLAIYESQKTGRVVELDTSLF